AMEAHSSSFYLQETQPLSATILEEPVVPEGPAGAATEWLPRSGSFATPVTTEQARVAFVGYPINAELVQAFGANGMSCHLYQKEESYAAVFLANASLDQVAEVAAHGALVVA